MLAPTPAAPGLLTPGGGRCPFGHQLATCCSFIHRAGQPVLVRSPAGVAVVGENFGMKMRSRLSMPLAVGVLAGLLSAGCTIRDAICRSEEYPVAAVDSTTGRACVADGEEPPTGFVRFPEGKVPKHVDDEWDVYWRDHKLDERGVEMA